MRRLLTMLAVLGLAACTILTPAHAPQLTKVSYDDLDGWAQDDHAAAFALFVQSCAAALARQAPYHIHRAPLGTVAAWEALCRKAQALPRLHASVARLFFERHFTPYRVTTTTSDTGRITGYYEPVLRGSFMRTNQYHVPVYGVPENLRKPDLSRAEIDAGKLGDRAPVLLYVEDPVMLFFMQVQGSGKVQLPSGRTVSLQYAAKNGHPYHAIGKTLKDRGALSTITMQTIREWLYAHPDEMTEVLHTNPSYIFFELATGDAYPKGALGIPLTPMRSLAIDAANATYGLPVYLDVALSGAEPDESPYLRRLLLSQDTGSGLQGAHRGDVFFGRGSRAERLAGAQNAPGRIYWLLPKTAHE